jgi:hypothetical protein
MTEIPTMNEEPDETDERYRRLSDRDPGGPSEAVRRAILRHAAELAAQVPTEKNAEARDRPAAKRSRRRVATYGGLAAAAALAGLLIVPHFLMAPTEPVAPLPLARSGPDTAASPPAPATAAPAPTSPAAPAPPPAERAAVIPRTEELSGLRQSPAAAAAPRASLSRATSPADPAAALREAAQRGDVPALRRLLAEKPNIDARDARGRSALMLAVLQGHPEAVNTLLAAGADPNAADASGTTPLQAALAGARSAIAVALEQSGAR